MYDLQVLALSYINEDRAKFGLNPVTLDDNPAAQSHAEDMKTGLYLGHWWRDGKKPYMVYTETGGTSYVSENVARSGFTAEEYGKYCSSATVRCEEVDPVEDMKRLHYSMMYDDASSNWGHRENILNPAHRKVSIGIAYFDHFFAFVQHFEGGTVTADARPTVSNGVMTVDATINEPGFDLFSVATIHYEPLPQPRTPGEIEELHAYCVGGGFSEECGTDVIRVIPPPPRGQRYTGLDAKTVVADEWSVSGRDIEITADLGSLVTRPGVYTLTLYADGSGNLSGETALQLTLDIN
jgi:hypothetical protein